ncbi:MAG: polyprenol monophosphomannose synthase [Pseudomonadota bacterium]|nr:polyprenol monophosphomannose synthase [Pseudomonadota bacterium]
MPAAVVVPTYNEAENIGPLVRALRDALPGVHVLVVDDASPDGTAAAAEAADAVVLRRVGPRGLGPAYRDGFARVLAEGFDPIVQMDADLSHDPADLPRLLAALAGADLVLGSRWVEGGGTVAWGLGRRALSRFGSTYARGWLGVPHRDLTGGFKAWRAGTLAKVNPATLHADGYAFQVEATWRAHQLGARIVEVPIVFTERRAGASKMSWGIAVEAAWRVPGLRL